MRYNRTITMATILADILVLKLHREMKDVRHSSLPIEFIGGKRSIYRIGQVSSSSSTVSRKIICIMLIKARLPTRSWLDRRDGDKMRTIHMLSEEIHVCRSSRTIPREMSLEVHRWYHNRIWTGQGIFIWSILAKPPIL
jgi:hypothetical protein